MNVSAFLLQFVAVAGSVSLRTAIKIFTYKIPTKMLLLLSIFLVALRFTSVESFQDTGCWARQTKPLSECIFSTSVSGRPEQEITYTINANFSQICCEVLQCTTISCSFTSEYCGYYKVWAIRGLPWEAVGVNVNPIIRCRGTQMETFYSYRFSIQAP